MRIVQVCPYSWSARGGVQTHVRHLSRNLTSRGHEVLVLAAGPLGRRVARVEPVTEHRGGGWPKVRLVGSSIRVPFNGSLAPICVQLRGPGLLPAERFPKAKEAALKALALDERLAEAHNALAFISHKWEWQWAVAERQFKRALQLEPNYALAHHWYSEFLSVIGRHEEALAGFAEARSLDPYSTAIRVDRAAALVRASRADDAVTVLEAAIKEDPKASALHSGLFNALWVLGRTDEAFEAFVRSRVLSGATDTAIERMRNTYRAGGFDGLMRADLEMLLEVERTGKSQGYYSRLSIAGTIARHYAIIGDRERALTWLEEAARRRDDGPLAMRTMWYWQPYKDDPRFRAIEREVGMP